MTDPPRMPAAFIGHGSPMNPLEINEFTRAWRVFGQALPRPRAVLAISALWFERRLNQESDLEADEPEAVLDLKQPPGEVGLVAGGSVGVIVAGVAPRR